MDMRPGGSVVRQGLIVMCVLLGMDTVRGARGLSVPFEERSVGAAAPCGPEPPCGAVWICNIISVEI